MIVFKIIFFIIIWFIGSFLIVKAAEMFGLVDYPETRRKDYEETCDDLWEE